MASDAISDPSPPELMRVMASRQRHLPKAVADSAGYRVLPGVRERLEQLHDAGYPLGLTTGGTEAAAHIKLARAELNHYFCFGGYGSDSPDRTELTRRGIERAGVVLGQATATTGARALRVGSRITGRQLQAGPRPFCNGRQATIVGTDGPDVIYGTPGRDVIAALGDELDVVLDGGPCVIGQPSTILDLTGPAPRILRLGAIPWEELNLR